MIFHPKNALKPLILLIKMELKKYYLWTALAGHKGMSFVRSD
jgi:hypothetical protein